MRQQQLASLLLQADSNLKQLMLWGHESACKGCTYVKQSGR